MFNIISLVFGLLAWIFPLFALLSKRQPRTAAFSYFCCSIALLSQLFDVRSRVRSSDWSALLDTMDAVAWVALILLLVTVGLNLAVFFKRRRTPVVVDTGI